MKLSEAIRKGSKAMRQEYGRWTGSGGGGCTLTMASYGCGIASLCLTAEELIFGNYELFKWFPILARESPIPCGCELKLANFHGIIHLNDRHFWSAERIAGWVESHLETPTYSLLEIQEFMGEPVKKEAEYV